MQTIDEISIGRDGDMFTLTIYTYGLEQVNDKRETFLIGLPDQLHAEVQRTIGQWLTYRRAVDESPVTMPMQPKPDNWPYDPDLARDMERGK